MVMVLDTGVLWTFTLLWLVVVPTPGANSLMVTHVAMTRTPLHVAVAIAGNMVGILVLAGGALLGWAALLEAFPALRLGVQILGAAYLVYFGWRLIVRSRTAVTPLDGADGGAASPGQDRPPGEMRRTFALGSLTALSNAQAIAFITGIYAVTGILQANVATGLASVAIMIACNATYLGMLGWLFRRETVRKGYARFRSAIEGTVGALFILLGGRLLYRELMR